MLFLCQIKYLKTGEYWKTLVELSTLLRLVNTKQFFLCFVKFEDSVL